MFDVKTLKAMKVSLASPDQIRKWSHGEVTRAETINYRSQKPEMDGLYCERIFGPSKDYECHCGKYRKMRYANCVCPTCGVEVTSKDVRRERMGHIELASPCCHIWYLKGTTSRIATLLELAAKELEEVAYYASWVCIDSGKLGKVPNPNYEPGKKSSEFLPNPCPDKTIISERNGRAIFLGIFKLILEHKEFFELVEGSEDELRIKEQVNRLDSGNTFVFDFSYNAYFVTKYAKTEFCIGGDAIKKLLAKVDLDAESVKVREKIKSEASKSKNAHHSYTKRLEIIESFRHSNNKPEWMVLDVIPVIPPDLRPMLQLDGGRFATSDLNDLYRRVIHRNKRLKDMISANTPDAIVINERRMLQEAVDALIDNGRRNKPVCGPSGRPLKSLSSSLKGKQGRFRQNLLGKRVDYSGRSVIAVGPTLKMYECGLPIEMAVQLLRPFIICELMKRRKECTHKVADNLVSAYDPQVYDIVEEIISKHPVLLNRAPTLHRLGIQAFQPRLVEGRAIRLHPLVCAGFNADFDGDQMAVHVPLSKAAQEEALHLMLASNNILGPKDGKPIVTPSQDMVLGNYYLTLEESKEDFLAKADKLDKSGDKKEAERFNVYANSEGKVFASVDDVLVAYQTKQIHLHNRIAILGSAMKKVNFTEEQNKSYLLTSVGKIIFNLIFPSDFPYINEMVKGVISPAEFAPRGSNVKELFTGREIIKPFKKGDLGKIINKVFQDYDKKGNPKTSAVLDKLKDQGFEYATVAGFTVSINDIHLVEGKQALLDQGDAKVKEIEDMYSYGLLTEKERHKQICDVWTNVLKDVQENLLDQFNKDTKNPIFMIMDSGARGNKSHITQLAGMRGLMGNTTGGTYEIPVKASFREGMSVSEFFAATHGARKGGTDTALRTADSGYLTRRLVDVSQDVIVREVDCHTDQGFEVSEIRDNSQNATIVKLYDRLVGRYALNDIVDPKTNEVIVQGNTMIQEDQAQRIVDAGIKRVTIRSLFTCQTKDGVCIHCYGRNMATGREVQIGEAVGIMAAQSIGEPGTQLTMRTFHTGGVAGSDITQGLPRVQELFEAHSPKGEATISMIDGTVDKIEEKAGVFTITVSNKLDVKEHVTSYGPTLRVKKGDVVEAGDKLTEGAIRLQDLLSYSSIEKVERYILKEVQKVYSLQEIGISDKHIEVIIKQMLRKVYIIDAGDTDLISGTSVDAVQFTEANQKVLVEGKRPAYCQPLILGITKSALGTQSFLSAASFQETTKVLTDAAIKGKTDILHGLKENVITGHLIPAGRGLISEEEEESIVNSFTVENTMAEVKDRYIEAHDRKIEELRNKFNKAEK